MAQTNVSLLTSVNIYSVTPEKYNHKVTIHFLNINCRWDTFCPIFVLLIARYYNPLLALEYYECDTD